MKLSTAPLSERAVGIAAAAVFAAGVISAGLVDSGGGPDGPGLAAPASVAAPAGNATGHPIDQLSLPPVPPPHGGGRGSAGIGSSSGANGARSATGQTTGDGGALSPTNPMGPSAPTGPSAPPPADSSTGPTPSVEVAVGPLDVGVSPAGPAVSTDNTEPGVTVQVDTGIAAPVAVHLP